MTVHLSDIVIAPFSKFYGRYILKAQHGTVAFRADDHVFIVGDILISTPVFQDIAECVFRFCSECSGRGFEVLLGKYRRNVRRHETVFAHLSRIEPYTERIITTAYIDLTDSCYT